MPKLHRFGADRITAIVLLALGMAVTYGGWVMDRLEIRHIHPASIPGLLPIILGCAMTICAVVLYSQASSKTAGTPDLTFSRANFGQFFLILAVTLTYAVGLVGNVPFWLATLIFIAIFICVFEWPAEATTKNIIRLASIATAEGALVAVGVSMLFEKVFLVRLP